MASEYAHVVEFLFSNIVPVMAGLLVSGCHIMMIWLVRLLMILCLCDFTRHLEVCVLICSYSGSVSQFKPPFMATVDMSSLLHHFQLQHFMTITIFLLRTTTAHWV